METQTDLIPESVIETLFDFSSDPARIEAQFENSAEKNILFITPTLTGENFYRIIMPFLALSDQDKTETAMLGLEKHNPVQLYEKKITQGLTSSRIMWANTIVFPFTTQPLKQLYEHIRFLNPTCKIVYNVEYNIFHLPDADALNLVINSDKMRDIDDNILYADMTLTDNNLLTKYLLEKHFSDASKYTDLPENIGNIQTMPFLAMPEAMYNRMEVVRSGPEKFCIGIPITEANYDQLKKFSKSIAELQKALPDKTEIIIIGGYKDDEKFIAATKDFTFTHIPPCPLNEYYNKLLTAGMDIFLYLSSSSFYNQTSDDIKRIVDFSLLGIPCIINKFSPVSSHITNQVNGFVLEKTSHFSQVIQQILTTPVLLDKTSIGCFDYAVRNFTYDNKMEVDRLTKLLS